MICKPFKELVDKRQREVIFACCRIELPVVDAHAVTSHHTCLDQLVLFIPHHCRASFLWHHMYGTHPLAVRDWVDDTCIKKFKNFLFHYLFEIGVESSLVLNRWLVVILE